ncbi:ribonucleoside-diphosphate reductase [Haladaptatus sp. NG-SE-30]
MTQVSDTSRDLRLNPDGMVGGYFRHAVYNHWDPYEDIPEKLLEQDLENLLADEELTADEFYELQKVVALFGAGEEAVTEDLAPLMAVLQDIDDQMFISSQIYEEAKHTQFFDRYWRDVLNPAAEDLEFEQLNPTNQEFFNDAYRTIFDDTEAAMHRLNSDDTPKNRVEAYCHYHLVVESVLAQTGYWGITSTFSDRGSDEVPTRELPHLEGLVEGVSYIRADEGRHVGFGMHKVQKHIREDGVDPQVVHDTLQSLMPHVANVVSTFGDATNPVPLVDYARSKLTRRIEIITSDENEIPEVEELVKLNDDTGAERVSAND